MRGFFIYFFMLIILLILNGSAEDLSGKITDKKSGIGIPNAVIWLENTQFKDTTDINGNYLIKNIPRGIYSVIIAAENYQQFANSNFPIDITDIGDENINIPDQFNLLQNFPNPFNPSTTIHYKLNQKSKITLSVFNINGKTVVTLDEGIKEPGEYFVKWDGTDKNHHPVASGIYFYSLSSGNQSITRAMVLIK